MIDLGANLLGALFVLAFLCFVLSAAFAVLCWLGDMRRWWKYRRGDTGKGLEPSYTDSAGGTSSDTSPPSRVAKQ